MLPALRMFSMLRNSKFLTRTKTGAPAPPLPEMRAMTKVTISSLPSHACGSPPDQLRSCLHPRKLRTKHFLSILCILRVSRTRTVLFQICRAKNSPLVPSHPRRRCRMPAYSPQKAHKESRTSCTRTPQWSYPSTSSLLPRGLATIKSNSYPLVLNFRSRRQMRVLSRAFLSPSRLLYQNRHPRSHFLSRRSRKMLQTLQKT